MKIEGNTRDLRMGPDGDLIFSQDQSYNQTPISIDNQDISFTVDPVDVVAKLILNRLTLSEVEWGNGITEDLKNGLLFLSGDAAQSFFKPAASLADFHGVTLNQESMNAIKTSVETALFLDDALNGLDVRVIVTRYTESSVNVSVVARATLDWLLSGFTDPKERIFFKPKIKDRVIIITMNYNTSSGLFSVSNIDLKEYLPGG